MFEANFEITSGNDFFMWYFISLMIDEHIPYLNFTYSVNLKVQIWQETSIYPMKIHTKQKRALYTFYIKFIIPLNLNFSYI